MIHIEGNIYRCPVCGKDKHMKAYEAKQDETCSKECGYILRENRKKLASIKEIENMYSDGLTEEQKEYMARSHTKLYSVWNGIKQRCRNPKSVNYQKYGAKGVDMCDSWFNDYRAFASWALKNGYVEKPGKLSADTLTVTRNGDSGNYEPSNCTIKKHCTNSAEVINGMNKPIHVYLSTDGLYHSSYKSLSDAARALDIRMAHIAETMDPKSTRKQVGGFIFSHDKCDRIEPPKGARNTSPIEAFNKEGESVGVFKTKKEACEALGIAAPSNISAVLNGRRNHAKGYTFEYIKN